MRRWRPELIALPLAHHPGMALRLVAVGESPVAGVGIHTHEQHGETRWRMKR